MVTMKTNKIFFAALTLLCVMTMTIMTTACSSDNDPQDPQDTKATQCTFVLTLKPGTGADDQQSIVKTVCTFPDSNGKNKTEELSDLNKELVIRPGVSLKPLPYTGTITITQTLREDADFTQKPSYKIGLSYSLLVNSLYPDNKIEDSKGYQADSHSTVPADKLKQIYPKTVTLKFTVDDKGVVAIE